MESLAFRWWVLHGERELGGEPRASCVRTCPSHHHQSEDRAQWLMMVALWFVRHGELGLGELEPASCVRSAHHSMGQILELELLAFRWWVHHGVRELGEPRASCDRTCPSHPHPHQSEVRVEWLMMVALWFVRHGELGLGELEPASCDRSAHHSMVQIQIPRMELLMVFRWWVHHGERELGGEPRASCVRTCPSHPHQREARVQWLMMVALLWLVHHGELGLDELEPASCDRSIHHSMGQILELELLVIECW